jgi:hypothetical protein
VEEEECTLFDIPCYFKHVRMNTNNFSKMKTEWVQNVSLCLGHREEIKVTKWFILGMTMKIMIDFDRLSERCIRIKVRRAISVLFKIFKFVNNHSHKSSDDTSMIMFISCDKYLQAHFLSDLCRSEVNELSASGRQDMVSLNRFTDNSHAQMKSRNVSRIIIPSNLLDIGHLDYKEIKLDPRNNQIKLSSSLGKILCN